ncbi:hypothetical protein [Candidatus Enterococcus clewellii]|uniref:Uncharacterized protein n=1 Tax=Candidatus Enterococcus clewellii TaxID=1834193 RepID=A0AAQ3VS89_9ENTE
MRETERTNAEKVKAYLLKNHPTIKIDKVIDHKEIDKVEIWGMLYSTHLRGGDFASFKKYFEHY